MIKAIIFDFAGVVGADGYWVWLRENVKDLESKKEFFHKISIEVDKGIITNEEFVKQIAENLGIEKEIIWPQIFEKIVINYELLNLIKNLKNSYKIGLLTNFTYQWMDELLEKHNLTLYFDQVLISSRHNLVKPEPEAFAKILGMLGVNKDEVIFIDDRQMHIDGANSFGIKTLLFTSNEQLKQDLESFDVEI